MAGDVDCCGSERGSLIVIMYVLSEVKYTNGLDRDLVASLGEAIEPILQWRSTIMHYSHSFCKIKIKGAEGRIDVVDRAVSDAEI